MKLLKRVILIILVVFIISGCAGRVKSSFHIREDVDFSFIKKVAVLPLDNLTGERFASDAVRQVVIQELLASGLVDVTLPGDAVTAVERAGVRSISSLTAEQIKAIGNALNVQAVIFGAVEKFGEVRVGTTFFAPEVTITLMMADVASGTILWSVTMTGVGDSFMARHFGARADTSSEIMLRVVRKAIQSLTRY